ncbi:molybdopterin-binding/glycosyltransferase family 2 protein [Rhizobium sp. KVB221]|uniref:Molybdopterin-binding/glycosyltransferase family 2 protein n=1 Tax=Rhizobium setariae TaxID=2801340 RepID=A0A936YNN9_9HYPH|nr:molybdopterin-binding/glycosyltransferase family 2 protein [Rhizobium setariae]MBL0373825.1 molybdopterin-binding/glycosyltransferase family 2 protein [Rhizobium setariae]
MKFGDVALQDAEGAVLAHSVSAGDLRFSKGRRLSANDVAALTARGVSSVIAATLDAGDMMEDEAAARIAAAVPIDHLKFSPASTGRVNIFATVNGLFRASREIVDAVNRVDPAITLACLRDHAEVKAGDMVATIKIIPLAVSSLAVDRAVELFGKRRPFEVKPFSGRQVVLVATELASLKPSVMDKTRRLLEARLRPSGSHVAVERRVPHRAEAVADAIRETYREHGMIIVFGASAVSDAEDVIPAAIRLAGGVVEQVGLPVDPGNLLVLGHVGDVPVIGAPGCARSPKENAFDWILARILAGEKPSVEELTGWGVGGLLMEIPSRPQPRLAGQAQDRRLHVAAVILAAGQARRMGSAGKHKLLAEFDGVPLVRKSVETVLASHADSALIVTGYRSEEIADAIGHGDLWTVHNPDFASGMASSLRAGLSAVEDVADGMLVMLADMPGVTHDDLDTLIAAFRAQEGRAIIRAVSDGKRGNPVILPRATFAALSRLEGDVGARTVIEESGQAIVDVEIGMAAHLDTDTPEEIQAAGGVIVN